MARCEGPPQVEVAAPPLRSACHSAAVKDRYLNAGGAGGSTHSGTSSSLCPTGILWKESGPQNGGKTRAAEGVRAKAAGCGLAQAKRGFLWNYRCGGGTRVRPQLPVSDCGPEVDSEGTPSVQSVIGRTWGRRSAMALARAGKKGVSWVYR